MQNGFLIFGSMILMIFSSCGKLATDPCDHSGLPVLSLEDEYGCVNTKRGMEIDLSNQFVIIRDQADFESLVTGTCIPDIDFLKYDLVVGKQGLTSGNVRIEYELTQDCEKSNLQLKVTFFQNITTEAPNLTYHAVIDKLQDLQGVDITIEEKFD